MSYDVVLLDPAWSYNNKQNGSADKHYATISVSDLARMPCFRDGTIAEDALVFCWITTPFLHHLWSSDARGFRGEGLLDHWRARYVTSLYWHKAPAREDVFRVGYERGYDDGDYQKGALKDAAESATAYMPKTPLGTGYWFRGEVEQLVVAVRGSFPALRSSRRNHVTHPPLKHSEKPAVFHDLIEAAILEAQRKKRLGPVSKLELFARRARLGWRCEGLELTGHDHRTPLAAPLKSFYLL